MINGPKINKEVIVSKLNSIMNRLTIEANNRKMEIEEATYKYGKICNDVEKKGQYIDTHR